MKRLRNWKGWRAACKTACFLLLLALTLGRADEVLALKSYDGLHTMQKFYEQPENTVDLLVLGSSHAYVNIDTGTLWDEYGIPSYDLGGRHTAYVEHLLLLERGVEDTEARADCDGRLYDHFYPRVQRQRTSGLQYFRDEMVLG